MEVESYAGTYIPMLMRQISEHNSAKKAPAIPLVGAAIGNGCWGNKVPSCSLRVVSQRKHSSMPRY